MASIRLEVCCPDAESGDVAAVVGATPELGEWDPSRALRLKASEANTWTSEFPMPTSASEFKLILIRGKDAKWEPFEGNRRWPTTGLGPGTLLRMKFGEAKIGIEASAAQIEASAKNTRKLEDRIGSVLDDNVKNKGEFAYYHAHSREFEVPVDAKVISGPGLITGGAPVLLEAGGDHLDGYNEERVVWLKDYSWSDGTSKVKVYVPVAEGVLPAEGAKDAVEASYSATKVELTINGKPRHKLTIEKLNAELNVESCSTRVEVQKNRIVLQLAKKRDTAWYNLTKSK